MRRPPMTKTIHIAGYQDARSVHTRAMRLLEASLKQSLGDGIAIEFEENIASRGRKVADLLDLAEVGELDLCYFSSSYLTARVPALGMFDIPFELTNRASTQALLQGELGARVAEHVSSRTGYRVLGPSGTSLGETSPTGCGRSVRPWTARESQFARCPAKATTPRSAH